MDLILFSSQFPKFSTQDELKKAVLAVWDKQFVHFSWDDPDFPGESFTLYDFGWHCTEGFRKLCRENGVNLTEECRLHAEFNRKWALAMSGLL